MASTTNFAFIPFALPTHHLARYHLDGPWEEHKRILELARNLVEADITVDFDEEPWPNVYEIIDLPCLQHLYTSDASVLDYLRSPSLRGLALRVSRGRSADDILGSLDTFLYRSACLLRRFSLRGFPDGTTTPKILQKLPSITGLGIVIDDCDACEGINLLMSTLTVSQVPGRTVAAPQLRDLFFACEDESRIDYTVYLEMLKSRWRAADCALDTATLAIEEGPGPDSATLDGLHALRQQGLGLSFAKGRGSTTHECPPRSLKRLRHLPSASSLAFRANLARLISPCDVYALACRSMKLAIHRIPTSRTLSKPPPIRPRRQLARIQEQIRTRVRYLFRKHQHATGTEKTRRELLRGYKVRSLCAQSDYYANCAILSGLEAFKKASEGDEKQRTPSSTATRGSSPRKVEKENWKRLVRAEVAWQARLRSRPILTGALIKPTLFSPPLPRMKPQPSAISQIILTRIRTRERRLARDEQLSEFMNDLRREAAFEEGIVRSAGGPFFERVYSGDAEQEWLYPLKAARADLGALLERDIARSQMPVPPALAETLRAARREKVANKTRERMREQRGEVLRCTIERARKGPPAHVLVRMTAAERRADQIIRGVGEVGYVGMVKRRMGVKLRDGGKGLARENGTDLEGERLEKLREMERQYWIEKNRRSRQNVERKQ
ncbi:hypothetical protein MVEN_01569100 [Mycena venus]|uniref:Uncharacterized protein n=1 Tax=Mycena venus TaxID=2733690 RepID=A0A8H7CRH8_9AGAR|nr:hypothetical protein MVEN_01569100 [Mycena venus]